MPDFEEYLSPFSWRYGSRTMRKIWSERNKRLLWRKVWVALAETQSEFGLVTSDQVDDLKAHAADVDIERAFEIEKQTHHDLVSELKTFAEQAPFGGTILHLGATSMDIEDNTDALRLRQSLELIRSRLKELLVSLSDQIERWAELPVIGFTHLQPAEPTTLGYRLAFTAQDLLDDWQTVDQLAGEIKGKGFKGAVGTAAAYADLIGLDNVDAFERKLSGHLGIPFFSIAHQTYSRKQEYLVVSALAGIAAVLHKFAFDLRLLQSPPIGELAEPFDAHQVGSSAMPFKRNPIQAEKTDSLARFLAQLPRVAWDNTALSLLERTLDDSANRRSLLPEAFLAADELLITTNKLVQGLRIDEAAIGRNLAVYGPFAATERVLAALSKAGGDRQQIHESLRRHSLDAWDAIRQGKPNPLADSILLDREYLQLLPSEELSRLLSIDTHVGIAPRRAREMARSIREIVG